LTGLYAGPKTVIILQAMCFHSVHEDGASTEEPFSIVVICTGNQIRSPAVEGFVREFAADLPVVVSSAGTLDGGGVGAYPVAVEAAARWGIDLSIHRSRTLADVSLAEADLVLGFERAHVARAVVDGGAASERTFTLPELVDLLDLVPPREHSDPRVRARAAVARAEELRSGAFAPPLREVGDPMGRKARDVRETIATVRELSRKLVEGLFGRGPSYGR
jgi:protein-tyrosine phosphatase